jgi:putative tryptophan/tyrosine transport system substrate-binding protein
LGEWLLEVMWSDGRNGLLQIVRMKRRTFLGAVASLPAVGAQAQPVAPKLVGYLHSFSPAYMAPFATAVLSGLKEAGYVEGQNLRIEYRTAEGHYDRLTPLAQELVALKVDALFAAGGSDPAKAAKSVTSTIPIVFVSAADPIRAGVVPSLNRPGSNVTGVSLLGSSLEPKRLEYLSRLAPGDRPIGAMVDPRYPDADLQVAELQKAGQLIKRPIEIVKAATEAEIDAAVAQASERHCGALAVAQDPFFNSHRGQIIGLANRYKLPAIFNQREFVEAGGLMSYGTSFRDGYRQGGLYLGRILKGAKPADLPVMQAEKFELVINQRTARTLGLDIPADIAAAADEVIE